MIANVDAVGDAGKVMAIRLHQIAPETTEEKKVTEKRKETEVKKRKRDGEVRLRLEAVVHVHHGRRP